MKKIGLVVKSDANVKVKADELESFLSKKDIAVIRKENPPSGSDRSRQNIPPPPPDLFCIVVLGGDGTFLSAVRWIGDRDIPVLGIKFGEVGFLAATEGRNLLTAVETILEKPIQTEPRMRLLVTVTRDGNERFREKVLNDVVINKGALARLAHIKTFIDEQYLTTYSADGLIISTPTGSTAYSLAAGGPVLHPAVPGIILTPICPFTLTNRPLIVPDTACLQLKLDEKSSDIMLTIDGQAGFEINGTDTVIVRRSKHSVRMIQLHGQQYYDVLKTKLNWSGGRT